MTTHYERRGDVAVLQIDNPPVNGLGHATRRSLVDGLERALDDSGVKAIVITGTDHVFSGGADIREFNTPAAMAEPNLLQVIDAVERSPKPVIAALNKEVNQVLASDTMRAWLDKQGMVAVGGTPDDFRRQIEVDYQARGELVRALGITAE